MVGLANDIDRLAHVDLFRTLNREILGILALSAQTRMIRAGHLIFREGEPANGGYLIVNGRLTFVNPHTLQHNNCDVQFHMNEGCFLGEWALLTPTVWDITLYAHTPVTLMHIARKDFLRLINAHPEAIPPIREFLERKLQAFIVACKDILASDET